MEQNEFNFEPIREVDGDSIPQRFVRFHAANPHVYDALVNLARQFRDRRGESKIGIGMLYEVLRWNYYMTTDSDDDYKLSNDFRAFYARKIMSENSDLKGIFATKQSIADEI